MVEQMIQQWHQNGGKGVPALLLPRPYKSEYLRKDTVTIITGKVTRPMVTALDIAVGIVFGSIEEAQPEEKPDAE